MKLRKRLGALVMSTAMLLTMVPTFAPRAAAAGNGSIVLTINSTSMTINGTAKNIDDKESKPVLEKGGYTMLPLRGVVEAMGGTLDWDAKTRTISMTKDSQNIKLTVGSTKATVDGTVRDMLANKGVYKAPYITNGKTMVHVRALELFTGTSCAWDQAAQQITVTYPDNSTPPVTSKNYRIDVINKSGADITDLRYGLTGSFKYSTENALSGTLSKGGTASFYISVPDNGTFRVYDFYTEGSAGTRIYSGLNLNGVNAYVTLVIKEGQKFEQANDKPISIAETELTFKNNSSRDVEELYMSKSSSFSDADNLLSSETVKSKKSTTIKIDLDGTKTWYFKAVNNKGKEFTGKVDFKSETEKTATLTLSSSEKLSLGNSNGGDITVALVNNTDQKIYKAFLVEKGEGRKFDIDDHEDEDLLDGDKLSAYSQVALEGVAEDQSYDMVLFYDTGDNDFDYFEVDLDKTESYATVYLNKYSGKRFDNKTYTDRDDKVIVALYNNTDEDIKDLEVKERDGSKRLESVSSLKDGDTAYFELDSRDYPDITITWSGNSRGVDVRDLDDEETFALITLNDDDDADVDGIDDI